MIESDQGSDSNCVLAFDVGTTSIKCAIINLKDFEIISKASTKAVVSYPKKGWAEKDPDVLWESIVNVARAVIEEKDFDVGRIAALIFGAHMAGVLPVDEHGEPLRDVIIWLDERAAGLPKDLWEGLVKIQGYSLTKLLKFLRITGGAPSRTGKDAISKILWIRENEPDIFSKTHKILDVKGFLVHRSTGAYVTSPDEANLSWLADTRGGRAEWSLSILKDYRLSANLFPEIKLSTDVAGKLRSDVAREIGLSDGIPVIVGAGDVCSAAVGSGAVGEGELHIYVGTSNWVAGHISKRRTDVFHYIGSLLSAIPEKYLLIAEQEIAAGALEWAMRLVGIEGKYEDIAEMIESAQPGRLIFMPWLYGERAPIDDPYVRGGLLNVSLEHGRGDVLRALMEGVALNIKWVYSFMEKLTVRQDYVNLVGGGTLFDVWCQIIADAIKRPVRRMKYPEQAGIRGLAAIASVGIGEVESFEVAAAKFPVDKIFKPDTENSAVYDRLFKT